VKTQDDWQDIIERKWPDIPPKFANALAEFVDNAAAEGAAWGIDWYGREIKTQNDLAQAFTDRHWERLTGLIRDIILAAHAQKWGLAAMIDAGVHSPGWSPQTIDRLAKLSAMPQELITNPETP